MFDRQGGRKYLNRTERRAFYRQAHNEPERRRRAFLLVLYYCGCRISEALNLSPERVDLAEKAIVFETLKRRRKGEFRSIPIPDSLVNLLRKIIADTEAAHRLWSFSRPTGYRLVKRVMQQAAIGGPQACPKGLRHGFAIACLGADIPLTTVRIWLGHARLETTAIYLEVRGEEERKLAQRLWKENEK